MKLSKIFLFFIFLFFLCNCRSSRFEEKPSVVLEIVSLVKTLEIAKKLLPKSNDIISIKLNNSQLEKCMFKRYLENSNFENILNEDCNDSLKSRIKVLDVGYSKYSDSNNNNLILYISEIIDEDKRGLLLQSIQDQVLVSEEVFILIQLDSNNKFQSILEKHMMY